MKRVEAAFADDRRTAPTAKTHRERWLGKARRMAGTAPAIILQTQGPVAREKSRIATQILRAGNILPGSRDNPRKWGPGKADLWT